MSMGDISSILLFIATATYALFTWKLVAETMKMRMAQTEPKISIISQPNSAYINIIEMKIENIGSGPAYNIRFDIKPDFEMRKGYWLSNIKLLKDGLHYFAPKQSYQFFLTSMLEDYDEKKSKKFEILVSYKNVEGKEFRDIYNIDLSIYTGMIRAGKPPLYDIAERIKEIKDDIHSLVTGSRRIKIIVFTQEDLKEELKEI